MPDPLQRFLDAQAPVYPQVHAELLAGEKRSHWMWFIFPQIHGLGSSPTAQHFAIRSLSEAQSFLAHPTLGPRLLECTRLVLQHPHRSAASIFSFPDDLKFRSSLTLFAQAGPDPAHNPFVDALQTFFAGEPDPATLRQLAQ